VSRPRGVRSLRTVLAVGGSDPTAGAGIAADIRTIESFGVQPTAVVTAVTVQTARRVSTVQPVSTALVRDQLYAVLDSTAVDVVKIGMLPTAAAATTVARVLDLYEVAVVLDPVMRPTKGRALGAPGVGKRLVRDLFPLATCVTANLREAAVLTGRRVRTLAEMQTAARALVALGARTAIVKGGHLEGDALDVVWDGRRMRVLSGARIGGGPMHGTGCAYASAVAALMARGFSLASAAAGAKRHVRVLIRSAVDAPTGGRLRAPRPRAAR